MRALVLSLLLIVLITMGLVMGKKVKETFEDMPAAMVAPPAPTNLIIPAPAVITATPQVDTIQRGLQEQAPDMPSPAVGEIRRPLGPGGEQRQGCPACPRCPDMSKYIRMDEIPCWNCTLP
jgi:hypothetical protein